MQGKCKIHILGGSHSAFSVLSLLLNGPCKIKVFDDYKRNCKIKTQVSKSAQKKQQSNVNNSESPNNTSSKLSPAKNQSK